MSMKLADMPVPLVIDRVPPEKASPIVALEVIGERLTDPIKPGPPDLIPGFLPKRGQLVIAGETDIGKSLVALEICSTMTTGRPLWGELKPAETCNRVLYILGEHYNDVIRRLWTVTGLPMSDEVWLMGPEQLGVDKWIVQNGRQNPMAIAKMVRWAEGADLVVFDPLSAFLTGSDAENDNIQMRLVLDSMSSVTQAVGASCIVLAHQGKPMMGKDGQEHSRTKYAIRGASAVEDAATNIFYMGRDSGSSGAASSRDSKVLVLKKRKYKGEAPDEYRLVRDKHRLIHTLLGNRPFVEVRQLETQAMFSRFAVAFPDAKQGELIAMVCAATTQSESSVRRALDVKEPAATTTSRTIKNVG